MMYTGAQIQAAARMLIGIPFRHQGRSGAGLDCIGLVAQVARMLGDEPTDFTEYGRRPRPRILLEHAAQGMHEIDPDDAEAGDVLLFWFHRRVPQHFAVMTGEGTIVHAYERAGRVVEQPLDGYWRARVCGAYRLKGRA